MTTLLKQSTKSEKIISLPKINGSLKPKQVIKRFMTYFTKVMQEEGQVLTYSETVEALSDLFDLEDIIITNVDKLTDIYTDKDIDTIKSGLEYLIYSNAKTKTTTVNGQQVLNSSILFYVKNINTIFVVVDDVVLPTKLDKQLKSYYYTNKKLLKFSFISSTFLMMLASASTYYGLEKGKFSVTDTARYLIEQYPVLKYEELNLKYGHSSGKLLATVRSDKKYQDKTLNKNSIFNQLGFTKVEVDTERYQGQDFDYNEFKLVEEAWKDIVNLIPHAESTPELKFRKLGKHKATGLFVPPLNIVAVDVRDTTSFIHEIGHHLDFYLSDTTLSTKKSFSHIQRQYVESLLLFKKNGSITQKMLTYYMTPTEVFARGFELWVHERVYNQKHSVLKKDHEAYCTEPQYIAFQTVIDEVMDYFDKLFEKNKTITYNIELKHKSYVYKNVGPTNVGEQLTLELF